MPELDAYKILQVDPEAEDEVIQAAYRRLARKYHPDMAEGLEAATRMAAINAAWELIGEPASRAAHDRARQAEGGTRGGVSAPWPADTGSVPGGPPPAWSAPTQPRPAPSPPTERQPPPPPSSSPPPPPESVSRDWISGRSTQGGGFDESMRAPDGLGAAGPPPGRPSGSALNFGRYSGWSLGEIGRRDMEYLEWLDRMPIGRPYRDEIDAILRAAGRRRSAEADSTERRGLFRRR